MHNSMQGKSDVKVLKITKSFEGFHNGCIIDIQKLGGLASLKVLWLHNVCLCEGKRCKERQPFKAPSWKARHRPSNLSQLRALQSLTISGYCEGIPDSLGQFSARRNLTMSGSFDGDIPNSLGQLYALETLMVIDCRRFSGKVPITHKTGAMV